MTKYNFIEETDKIAKKALDHEITRSKIDETLMNLKAPKGGLEEMALEEIAMRGAAVGRALQFDRDPHLLRAGFERPADQPWLDWDPVMVHIQKPEKIIYLIEVAINDLNSLRPTDDRILSEAILRRFIECIKEQI
jgi:hypothetical protein